MGGEATVTVTSNENNKSAVCRITVIEPVTAVALDKNEHTMFVGEDITLGVIVSPSDANNKTVKWTSTDPAVVTVSSIRPLCCYGQLSRCCNGNEVRRCNGNR